jgi:hypothetical protein
MSAVLFNLWNVYLRSDGTLTFEATQADTLRIGRGSRAFLDAALRALGVVIDDYTWRITAGRSLYYSDDPEAAEWRDRWARTWKVEVSPAVQLAARSNALFRAPVALGPSDDSDDSGTTDGDHVGFLIVDFQRSRADVECVVDEIRSGFPWSAGEAEMRELVGGIHQVHLTCRLELPARIAALDELSGAFRAAGGAVNWRWRLTWPQPPPGPAPPGLAEWLRDFDQLRKKS